MSGGGGSGGARVSIAGGLKKTIQDIREIAGEHSDEDIYAMLKECSMDPNETTQRLLHLDTFHEVKKKHGKKKENVGVKASDVTGKQPGARVRRGAKVGGGNFHSQNSSEINVRRSFGGSKENGFASVSKVHKSENKTTVENSRSVHVKVNGKGIKNESPQADVKSDDSSAPADGGKPLSPASISPKQENVSSIKNHVGSTTPVVQLQPLASMPSENTDVVPPGNLIHENQYAVSIGNASWSADKIKEAAPRTEIVDTAKSQPTVFNSKYQPSQARGAVNETVFCAEKQPVSEVDLSILNKETSKLTVSDGHVVFPEHLQVPEAYKKKLTFGSFGSSWPLGDKTASDSGAVGTDMPIPADDSCLGTTVAKSSIESSGSISSIVKDVPDRENPSYIQSPPPPISNKTTPALFERASSDVVIKIDEPDTESLLRNGGPDNVYHPSNHGFGYTPKSQLQAHDIAEPQGGNFITSSASGVDRNSNIQLQPPGVTHDTVSSPPLGPFLRQTYHPNFFPYGHYYHQFFVPPVQQYVAHGGFPPQQPLVPNVYLTSPASGGIKYPHPQQKQGSNGGTDGYVGVPSGYNPYVPYAFPPYGLPPTTISGNFTGDEEHDAQLKENAALTNEQQTESSGEWMAGTGRTVLGLQINPFYNIAPGQGHPMVFPPTPTGFGPFGGVYHPSVQAIPAPQPTVHPQHNHQPHPMGSAELPPTGFYQQQPPPPQGAHIIGNNNK